MLDLDSDGKYVTIDFPKPAREENKEKPYEEPYFKTKYRLFEKPDMK